MLVVLVRQARCRRSRAGSMRRGIGRLTRGRAQRRGCALDLVAKVIVFGGGGVALAVLDRQNAFRRDATTSLA